MDDKFEFMPFDVLEDYGPMHFGPFHTKNYPIEIDWDGSSYIAKINGITYDLPYLTKWVIPVDELENRAKNKISFNAISTGDCETSAILEVKAKVHDDEYCFLRVPITGGQEKDYILSANELEGYEGIIDFALYTCHDPKINVSINKIKISSAGKNVEYCERDYLRERLIDIVQPEINGEIIKRIECKLL